MTPTCSCSRPITDSAALCHPCGEAQNRETQR